MAQYGNAYHTWLALLHPNCTYQHLKVHFTTEYQLLNKMNQLAREADYHSVSMATSEEAPE
eukprot:548592-Ditylum_brightwellii.AAC.1